MKELMARVRGYIYVPTSAETVSDALDEIQRRLAEAGVNADNLSVVSAELRSEIAGGRCVDATAPQLGAEIDVKERQPDQAIEATDKTKVMFVTYKVDGRYTVLVDCVAGETLADVLECAGSKYASADFGCLRDVFYDIGSVVDAHGRWYIDGGVWCAPETEPLHAGTYTVTLHVEGRADFDVRAEHGSTLDDVLATAESAYCDADFGELEDVGDYDTRPIIVQDENNWYLEDETRFQPDDAVIA